MQGKSNDTLKATILTYPFALTLTFPKELSIHFIRYRYFSDDPTDRGGFFS